MQVHACVQCIRLAKHVSVHTHESGPIKKKKRKEGKGETKRSNTLVSYIYTIGVCMCI